MSVAPSRAIIDLGAYAHNLRYVRSVIPSNCRILAVVKGNAYGHGAAAIATRAVEEGVHMLGVATVQEAVELRQAGITAPILLMVQPTNDAIPAAIEYGLRIIVGDAGAAERIGKHAQRVNKVALVHCKIDTGMGRQGFDAETAAKDLSHLTRISFIDIEGICTHFPVADFTKHSYTPNQIKIFGRLLRHLEKDGFPYEMVHAANSAAIINFPASAFDMVRPGLMTYGIWPTDTPPEKPPLRPVLRWETRIIQVKRIAAGSTIGYGRTFTASNPMRAAVLPVGYADGYPYGLSNNADVLIRGKRCPVLGAVSMDMIVVDISHVPEADVEDTATLIGSDGNDVITAEELASRAQTIPYDVLTRIGRRVKRIFIG